MKNQICYILLLICFEQIGLSQQWNHLGTGLIYGVVAITPADTSVYIGGYFFNAGGNSDADYGARWDGCEWHPIGPGLNGYVYSIAVSGNDVYVGGEFTQPYPYLARWDGTQWNPVGAAPPNPVTAILIDGSNVIIGGGDWFNNSGFVSQWNGSSWISLGIFNDAVGSLAKDAAYIYAGGTFEDVGGNPDADGIVRWDGSTWLNMGDAGMYVHILDILISDNELYVAGCFFNLGGNPEADNVAKWDGNNWIGLGFTSGNCMESITEFQGSIHGSVFTINGSGPPYFDAGIYYFDSNSGEWEVFDYIDVEEFWLSPLSSDENNLYVGVDDYMQIDDETYFGIARWGPPEIYEEIPGVTDTLCTYNQSVNLPTNINGYTGNWSGQGVSNNIFNPNAQSGVIPIEFIPDPGQCVDPDESEITVINMFPTTWHVECDDNNTPSDGTDDIISIRVTPVGYHIGSNYTVSVSSGTITPGTGMYNTTNSFQLQPGSAGNGNITLTITDNATPFCSFDFLIEDPGTCSENLDCPIGLDTTLVNITGTGCPNSIDLNWLAETVFGEMGGTWEGFENETYYDPCLDGNGPFYYSWTPDGCPEVHDTMSFEWTSDPPCDWQFEMICFDPNDATIYVDIPPFPGNDPPFSYTLLGWGTFSWPGFNSGIFQSIGSGGFFGGVEGGCYNAQIGAMPDGGGCTWYFGGIYSFNNEFTICVTEMCGCVDPPYAGENSSITLCNDSQPFDLTTSLGGNPDAGGTWWPPLNSGGNIYDPILDGSGTFTYTVSAPNCPDDMASVTVGIVDLSESTILVSCDDNDTPSDETDDIISITVTPVGYHVGPNYTVSVSSGTITPSTGLYNTTTSFQLQPGSAGNGDVTLTITDNASPFCSFDFLIEDPGTCSYPCPPGMDTVLFIDSLGINGTVIWEESMLLWFDLPTDGYWEPPLQLPGFYNFCLDDASVYIYTHIYPGCEPVQDTVDFDLLWNPCNWVFESICNSDDSIYFTIPPFIGGPPGATYYLNLGNPYGIYPNLSIDSTYTFVFENFFGYGSCLGVQLILNGFANWDWGLAIDYELYDANTFIICPPPCSCSDPPEAGEDNSISVCSDTMPFDLTLFINGNPDPGGTWTPPLNSGGNIYDPVLDGPGIFSYTVTAPDCPDDMASVTVGVVDLSESTIQVSCDDNGTPSDSTDDIITIIVTPIGSHAGPNYTVSVSSGTIMPGTGLYNTTTNFQLQPGSAGIGNVTLTITDNAFPFCSFDFLIEDPGTCSTNCPGGQYNTYEICPYWSGYYSLVAQFGLPFNGTWEPPLSDPFQQLYYSCTDSGSVYIYPHVYPGCQVVYDTAHFELTWDPCAWEDLIFCYVDSGVYITISDLPGSSGTYDFIIAASYDSDTTENDGYTWEDFIQLGLDFDSSYTLFFPVDWEFADYDVRCIEFFAHYPLENCNYWFQAEDEDGDGWHGTCDVPSCSCTDPPEAGENNAINICVDANPFDLTTSLGGTPDIGGTWTPPLASGGNIYDPVLDGSGSFIYTVVAGGCPDDSASVTVTVTLLFTPPITGVPSTICEEALPIPLPTVQSGISGNWSGNGVSNNTFDPAGLMGTIVLTFSPDPIQCAQTANTIIVVTAPVQTAISGIPFTYCESSPPWPLPPIQSGINGNWSGTGVANNIFNPAGLSGMVTLTFTPLPNQCASPAIHTINVGLPISPLIVLPGTICILSPPIALDTIQSGIHGNWSGPGVSSNIFDPTGLNGLVTLTFTPNLGECASVVTATIDVIEEMNYTFSIPDSICQMDAPIPLPINPGNVFGNWSGPGVINNVFDPDSLSGTISLSFIPDVGQCAVSATISIVVNVLQVPDVSNIPSVLCKSSVPIDLPTVLEGIIGGWTGPGVINNSFDPSSQDGIVTLTFTPLPGQCALGTEVLINIITEVVLSITEFPDTVCSSAMPISLATIQDGFNGNWSGQGVTNNTFNPLGLNGDQLLTFQPDNNDCVDPVPANIHVQNEYSPVITELPNGLCQLNSIILPAEVDGVFGTWDGMGVTNFLFNPIGLSDSVLLQFNPDTGQCAADASAYIIITPPVQPVITAAPSSICQNNTSILLSDIQDGIAGSWSGPGITQDTFTPIGLSGNVLISFLPDSGQCALPANSTVEILQPPGFTNLIATCDSTAQTYTVSFDIQGGLIGTYEVNGNIEIDSHFVSSPIDDDSLLYSFLLDDANHCGPVMIDGVKNCACATAAGTMDFTVNPIKVCDGNDFTVVHKHDENLDLDDKLLFILHDQPGGILGTVLATSNTSIFSFPTGINFGQVYYVSAVAGSTAGLDSIDLLDPCLSVSQGVPIIFLPTAQSSIQSTICSDDSIVVHNVVYNKSNPAGTETIIGGSYNGCDSIVSIQLSFWPEATYNLAETLCFGSSIVVNGIVYDETNYTGTEVKPGGSIHGCDSIIHIILAFDSIVQGDLKLTLCQGESVVINGNLYDENHFEDDEVFMNGSSQGCDSVLHVSVDFYQEAWFAIKDTLDIGDSLIVEGVAYHAGYPAGIVIIEGGSSNGCDSIIEVDLHFRTSVLTASIQSIPPLCFGDSTGLVTIESVSGDYDTIRMSLDGMPTLLIIDFPFSINGLTAGMHSLWMVDVASMSDTLWLEFYLEEPQVLELDAGPDQNVTFGEDVQLNAQASFTVDSWLWSPADFLSCSDCPDPVVIHPLHDILYTLLAEDQNNCQVSDDVLIQVIDDVEVYFPTVFSPNGDGINDRATVHTNQDLLVKSLSIYDRWGGLIHQQTDFPVNDPAHGWDGTFNGKEMGPGVYVWVAEVVLRSGIITVSKGDLTLIR